MQRKIIKIDEKKCNGCGICIPSCAEGALQLIDGKARLISDLFCDGLGACIGDCPQGAISIEEREALPYDEKRVMEEIVKGGPGVIKAHLEHLKDHKQYEYLNSAIKYLKEHSIKNPLEEVASDKSPPPGFRCPGPEKKVFARQVTSSKQCGTGPSALTHWPVQMHLIQPFAEHFRGSDFLLAADCCAFAYGSFHNDFIRNRTIGIACPKLDTEKEIYQQKLISLIEDAEINTLTVAIMEVPCCRGLFATAQQAVSRAKRKVPLKLVIIGIEGDIIREEWL